MLTNRTLPARLLAPLPACVLLLGAVAQAAAPAGQTTSPAVPVADFASSTSGWTATGTGTVEQTPGVGHGGPGALAVTSSGARTGGRSAPFSVTAGLRYRAGGWVRAQTTARTVSLGLEFRDGAGTVIGTQTGQALPDSAQTWMPLSDVLGFAPSGAVSGQVVLLDVDGPAGDVQLLDDIVVTRTEGSPAGLAGPLTTSGPLVLDSTGQVVHLQGVDLDGLQTSSTAGVSTSEIAVARSWGANFVRIPMAQNFLLSGDCSYDSAYQGRIDALVSFATNRGMLVLLDLHTQAVVPCSTPRQQAMPDAKSVTFWRLLASRYRTNPLVAFDLYNEPHDVSDVVWRDGGTVLSGGMRYRAAGLQQLYDTVRGAGAENLVFTGGPNWASSYPTQAPLTGTRNVVHAVHSYTCPRGTPESGAKCSTGPDGTVYDPTGVLGRFDGLTSRVPLMLTEFGFPSAQESRYNARAIAYVTAHGWVGWNAFTFDGGNAGMFSLWKNTAGTIDPNPAGMPIMLGMLGS